MEEQFYNIPLSKLKSVYQSGPGLNNAIFGLAYHIMAPEFMSMPHTDKLKKQVLAAILYNESLPLNKQEKDPEGPNKDGYKYVGYNTYGILSDQSGNVNKQGTKNNAASKVMGGIRYKINEDGSIDVRDGYGFGTIRDFSKKILKIILKLINLMNTMILMRENHFEDFLMI